MQKQESSNSLKVPRLYIYSLKKIIPEFASLYVLFHEPISECRISAQGIKIKWSQTEVNTFLNKCSTEF
jgi:hypothetical protein